MQGGGGRSLRAVSVRPRDSRAPAAYILPPSICCLSLCPARPPADPSTAAGRGISCELRQ